MCSVLLVVCQFSFDVRCLLFVGCCLLLVVWAFVVCLLIVVLVLVSLLLIGGRCIGLCCLLFRWLFVVGCWLVASCSLSVVCYSFFVFGCWLLAGAVFIVLFVCCLLCDVCCGLSVD